MSKYKESYEYAQAIVGRSDGRPTDDFYPTPVIATEALLGVEELGKFIWEPACGDGAISKVLIANGYNVLSSDKYDHGYGYTGIDYLECTYAMSRTVVTNPPFMLLERFVEKSFELGVTKLCLLAKLSALEGARRSRLFEETPLKNIWVFRKRLTMTRNGEPSRNGGMIAFAWYVWDSGYSGKPMVGWI